VYHELAKSVNDFSFGMLFMSQVLCAFIMYHKGRHHRLQRMMFWFMVYLLSITIFEIFFFYLSPEGKDALTSEFTDIIEMTVVPWALLIIIRLTHPKRSLKSVVIINTLIYGLSLLIFAGTQSIAFYKSLLIFTQIYSLAIIVYGFIAVKQFNRVLADNFSDEKLSLYWLKYIMYLYIVMIGVWTFATIVATDFSVAIYNVSMMPAFGMFCYFVYKQEDMLEALESSGIEGHEEKVQDSHENVELLKLRDYHFADSFENVFSIDRIYLNPKLNINDLARALGTNRTYVSNYINQQLHTTFYEYVNKWRIKRAKQLLLSTSLPLEDIAEQSGFNSLSSFRRYFVSSENKTPMAYRKFKGK
jgi:AraC-like DNA-binding protein